MSILTFFFLKDFNDYILVAGFLRSGVFPFFSNPNFLGSKKKLSGTVNLWCKTNPGVVEDKGILLDTT